MNVDFETQTGMFLGLYEIELNRYLRRLAASATMILDIGANVGYHSLLLAKFSPATVVAFEPDTDSFAMLGANVALNPTISSRLRLEQSSIGSATNVRLRQIALDDFMSQNRSLTPEVLKIDVDGSELDVLTGATKLLHSFHPSIVLETHSTELEQECGLLLRAAGYNVTIVNQRSFLRDYRPLAHNRWLVAVAEPSQEHGSCGRQPSASPDAPLKTAGVALRPPA